MNSPAALRPLHEVADAIRRLEDSTTADDLTRAVLEVTAAIEESLRLRLDDWDPSLPFDEVVKRPRTGGLISLEAAGTVHEARAAGRRAADGSVRAEDPERVRAAVERLRTEFGAAAPAAEAGASDVSTPGDAGDAAGSGAQASGPPTRPKPAVASSYGGGWMRWIAAAIAAVLLLGAVWMGIRGGGQDYDDALAAFRAGRVDSAAVGFERVLEARPRDVTVMLYLARSYRRLDRHEEAAEVLRRARDRDPADGDVRRELGHLFMDLARPAAAVTQYERALEHEPEEPLNWAALIRALRALDDPRADRLLRDAPAEVRAALSGG